MVRLLCLLCLLLFLPGLALADPWGLDPATTIVVDVPWEGATVAVHFPPPTGSIDFDPENPATARATVTVSARGATTGVPIVDALVRLYELDGVFGIAAMGARKGLDELAVTRAYTRLGEVLGIDWAQQQVARFVRSTSRRA